MTPEQRAIWDRMPEADRERTREASGYVDLGNVVELWQAAQDWQAKLDRGDRRALKAERERSGQLTDEQQDELDERLILRCQAGEYGPESKRAIEDLVSGWGASRRAFLREARRAVVAARRGIL